MTDHANAAAQPHSAEAPRAATPPPPPPGQPAAHPQPYMQSDPRQKSPFLAGLLSFMPGLGQIYTGYYQRGFIHAIVIAGLITLLASDVLDSLIPLAAVFMAFFWLYNVIDAARRATLYNQALAGIGDVELPEDWKAPGFPGSIVGGLLIAAFGFVLLMETAWNFSLRWLEDWWPVGVIAFGLYLVWKAIEDRKKREKDAAELD
jgi:TM2 domain-containing membrane protein YozV